MAYCDKYLDVLKRFDDFVSIKEWVNKIIELHPEELEKAEKLKSKEKRTALGKLEKALSSRIKSKKQLVGV